MNYVEDDDNMFRRGIYILSVPQIQISERSGWTHAFDEGNLYDLHSICFDHKGIKKGGQKLIINMCILNCLLAR